MMRILPGHGHVERRRPYGGLHVRRQRRGRALVEDGIRCPAKLLVPFYTGVPPILQADCTDLACSPHLYYPAGQVHCIYQCGFGLLRHYPRAKVPVV
jgi:hypothetical protein